MPITITGEGTHTMVQADNFFSQAIDGLTSMFTGGATVAPTPDEAFYGGLACLGIGAAVGSSVARNRLKKYVPANAPEKPLLGIW